MRRKVVAAALAAALLGWLFPSAPASAHPLEVVPSDHKTYQTLYRLASWGLAPLWAASARPLSRIELAGMVAWGLERLAENRSRPASALEDLEGLVLEFADELALLGYRVIDPPMAPSARSITGWGVRFDRALVARVETGTIPRGERSRGSGLYLEGRGSMGFGPALMLGAEAKLGFTWGEDPWNGLRRIYLSGHALAERPYNAIIQAGRDSLWWGPGHRGAFMLSDNAGPLEFVRANAMVGEVRVIKLFAPIDYQGRHLYGMRLDWLPKENLRVGLGETVLADKGIYAPYLLNPIPGLNYAILHWVRRTTGFDDNYTLALDADWRIRPGVVAYGELLLDDFIFGHYISFGRPEPYPHRLGGTIGVLIAEPFGAANTDLRLEHSRVSNWVYATTGSANDYLKGARALGHWCAPDCELWSATLVRRLSGGGEAQFAYEFVRKGEGALGQAWADPDEAWEKLYMWGVIETTHALRLTYAWARDSGLEQAVTLGLALVANAGHSTGANRQDWYVRWEARYGF